MLIEIYTGHSHENKFFDLMSSEHLYKAAQESFQSDWQMCWAIMSYISYNRSELLITDNLGPDLETMYGECLRLKINDLFQRGGGYTPVLTDEAKVAILTDVVKNLEFNDAFAPFLAAPAPSENKDPDWPWPITDIPTGNGGGQFAEGFANASALRILGYKVGVKGLVEEERIELLERFFTKPLPSIVSKLFADAWGTPGSEKRLKKMADTISSNCKNFKRNDADKYKVAIEEWESDLGWLRKKFYKRGKFPWPDTFVD